MTGIKTGASRGSSARRFKLLRCAALSSVLVFAACEAQAQSTRDYGGRNYSRGGGGGHHRGGGGGGWGGAAAGALIGLGVGIIANEVTRPRRRTETVIEEYEERPARRRPPKRRVVEQGPDGYEQAEPRDRKRKPKREPRVVVEPKPKVVRAAPVKLERPSKVERARLQPKPGKGGTPPAPPPIATPAPIAPAPAIVAAAGQSFVPDEVLCEVRAGTPESEILALGERQRLERVSMERFDLTGATVIRYRIRDNRPVATAVSDLQNDPVVASAQPNNVFELSLEAAADLASTQYAVAMMRLGEAHAAAKGTGVKIAVIDSAVDASHPSLKGAVVETFDPIGGEAKPHAHGTAVAGLAAGRGDIMSPAPAAEIYAVRAFAPEQKARPGAQGTTMHILRGIDWAASRGVKVVNMSFAGPQDAKISEFIAAGMAKGAIYVAAAGNAGPSSPPLYPAADPNVIAVTAVDAEDGLLKVANRGSYVSVAAPGVDVLVAAPGGGFGYLTGTSMASAGVAGLVALLVEARPGLPAWRARAALTGSARDLGAPGPDAEFGAGAADARAALDALDAPAADPSTPVAGAPRPSAEAAPVPAATTDVAQRP